MGKFVEPHPLLYLVDWGIVKCVLLLPISTFFIFVVLPLVTFIFGIFFMYRTLVIYWAKVTHGPNSVEVLDPFSSLFATADDIYNAPFLVMAGSSILEGTPDLARLKLAIRDRWFGKKEEKTGEACYPTLLQPLKFIGGIPFWNKAANLKEETVLDECVQFYDGNGIESCSSSRLKEITKDFSLKPFPKDMPLWEVLVVEKYVPDPVKNADLDPRKPYFVLILRMQHSLCDGVSMTWLTKDLSLHSLEERFPISEIKRGEMVKSGGGYLKKYLGLGRKGLTTYVECLDLILEQLVYGFGSPNWPVKYVHAVERRDRLSVGNTVMLRMSEINKIKVTHGVSGMSVIMVGVLRAVKKALFEEMDVIPTFIQLWMPIPLPREDGTLRNRFTGLSVLLPTFIEDPAVHLGEVDKALAQKSGSALPYIFAMGFFIIGFPPRHVFRYMFERYGDGLGSGNSDHIALSNVAGPKNLRDVAGYPFRGAIVSGSPAFKRSFPMLYFSSIDGRANFGVVADKMVIPSDAKADELTDNFLEELRRLEKLKES